MTGKVYFIRQGGAGPVKIGYTMRSLRARLRGLQTASAEPLVVLATVTGTLCTEQSFHAQYSHLRIRGEWFKYCPTMEDPELKVPELEGRPEPIVKRVGLAPGATSLIARAASYFWASREEMSDACCDIGLTVSARACGNYRAGITEPSYSAGNTILSEVASGLRARIEADTCLLAEIDDALELPARIVRSRAASLILGVCQ